MNDEQLLERIQLIREQEAKFPHQQVKISFVTAGKIAEAIHNDLVPVFHGKRDNTDETWQAVMNSIKEHTGLKKESDLKYLTWQINSDFVGGSIQPSDIDRMLIQFLRR